MTEPKTLFDKTWGPTWSISRTMEPSCLLYVDRHLVHE